MRPGVLREGWPDEIKGDIKGREEGLLRGSFQERAEMQGSAPSTFREDECVNLRAHWGHLHSASSVSRAEFLSRSCLGGDTPMLTAQPMDL